MTPKAAVRTDAAAFHPRLARGIPAPTHMATGDRILDEALGGGLPHGALVLFDSEEGAGATELAMAVLRHVAPAGRAVYASALRAPRRVQAEMEALLGANGPTVEVRALAERDPAAEAAAILATLSPGDLLVVESVAALSRASPGQEPAAMLQALGDLAAERGAVIVVLHARGTLTARDEANVAEAADAILHFRWTADGPSRSRRMSFRKLRGLGPALDGDRTPVYEVSLRRGHGFSTSEVRQLV